MAGERTPLFSTNGSTPRRDNRVFYANIAVGVALVCAIGAVVHSATSSGNTSATSVTSVMSATSATTEDALLGAAINDDNWFCGETKFEADYIKLSDKKGDDEYFYWFVPSRSDDPTKDPLVLWLTGGPGGSSMLAMFMENGPCLVNTDVTTSWNPYSWTNKANVVWLDQPSGVGFSVLDTDEDADYTEADVGPNMWAFLNGFMDKHPEFVGRDFYITGESYGGHYVPAGSHYIWEQNKKLTEGEPKRINLQGIAIGNGLTNPNIQFKYIVDMAQQNAYNISLLTDAEIEQMKVDSVECIALLEQCQRLPPTDNTASCLASMDCWDQKLIAPFRKANRNVYDIRRTCSWDQPDSCGLDTTSLAHYFELEVVKKHLPMLKRSWHELDTDVNDAFSRSGDASFAYHTYVADLLNDGLRVLIYAGDADLMCNWIGNRAWTLDLDWSGKEGFNAAEEHAFQTQDPFVEKAPVVDAGVARQFENFAFVRVYESGHMVPTNQPAVAWVLLDKFLNGEQL